MTGPLHRPRLLHRIAAGLLVVLLLGPTLSVASTCAADAPPTAAREHGGHGAAAGQDACCAEEGPAPDCSGATPCTSPCGVLPTGLALDAALPAADPAETARGFGSLAVPPPRPPPIP